MFCQVLTLLCLGHPLGGGGRRGEMAGVARPRKRADRVSHCLHHDPRIKHPAVSAAPQFLTRLALVFHLLSPYLHPTIFSCRSFPCLFVNDISSNYIFNLSISSCITTFPILSPLILLFVQTEPYLG